MFTMPPRWSTLATTSGPLRGNPMKGRLKLGHLPRVFRSKGKLNALTNILLSRGSHLDKRSKGPSFVFAGHPVHRPHYTVFYRCDQPDRSVCQEQLPVIGYLNYTDVSGIRWHKCQPRHHGGGDDSAISRLGKKKFDQVTPKEWTEDPYFVCVLLSLAQFQQRRLKSPRPKIHLSRLLIASPMDRHFIHLYEARITCDLLRMLDNPAAATVQANFPTIERTQIPFRPFETFQERILAQLSVKDISPHVSRKHNTMNQNFKRAHEHEDDESFKRGRTS
ncbi:hypothetical protein HAV15_009611 [Penicillium sp. str. |nr:hypothetical protein HAV15_009611 [Penicillium sp. str. \